MSTPFSIIADLPLGTYRGAAVDGGVDALPSVARLYSALLCAAGFGPRATIAGDRTGPCTDDEVALRWLEEHLPDAVTIPPLQVNHPSAIAYRDGGTLRKDKAALRINKLPKAPDASVAVHGSFVWTWTDPPPDEVMSALSALCRDVPYLGTTESPVRLHVARDDQPSTHELDPDAGLFAAGGRDVEVPLVGRLDELATAHVATTGAPPKPAADRVGSDERSSSVAPPRDRVAVARYSALGRPVANVPWPRVLVLPVDRTIAERDRVRWAVAVHRALIAAIRAGAPPVLSGAYPEGMRPPANRVALHIIDRSSGATIDSPSALVVLLPREIDPADLDTVASAVAGLRTVRGPRGAFLRVTGSAENMPGDEFWPPPAPGVKRTWRTSPPAVPDSRGWGDDWTFADAALLSLGHVWRYAPQLKGPDGRGRARAQGLVEATAAQQVHVLRAEPLRTTKVHYYVHRVNEHAVIRPYQAELDLGALCGPRTIQAIGQSRHLGGGLLVPSDLATAGHDARLERQKVPR